MRLLGIGWCVALTAVGLAACGSGEGRGGSPAADGPSARQMKEQVDAATAEVVPRIRSAFGDATLTGPRAGFTECQMGRGWSYDASFAFTFATPDGDPRLEAFTAALEEAGFSDVRVGDDREVSAHRDHVHAHAFGPVPGSRPAVYNVDLGIDCTRLDDEGAAFAEADEGTDFPGLG